MRAAGNDEPIPFNRVGDGGRRAQVAKGLPLLRWPPVASLSLRIMRTAAFSSAPIFGGLRRLLRRFGAVRFGRGAFREKAQRGRMQPRRE